MPRQRTGQEGLELLVTLERLDHRAPTELAPELEIQAELLQRIGQEGLELLEIRVRREPMVQTALEQHLVVLAEPHLQAGRIV